MVGNAETFHLAAVSGRRAEALKVLDQLTELSKQKYVPAERMALIYTGLGEKDKAIEWLATRKHSIWLRCRAEGQRRGKCSIN